MRSIRLPSAPPRMKASARQNSFSVSCLRSNQTINTEATTAMRLNNQSCIPPASLRKLNAAPVLCASTRLKNDVMATLSPKTKWLLIAALLNWSRRMTMAEIANHRKNSPLTLVGAGERIFISKPPSPLAPLPLAGEGNGLPDYAYFLASPLPNRLLTPPPHLVG